MSILDQLKSGLVTHSADETSAAAALLTNEIPDDQVIALHGDLGAGKTTFVKGLATGWGISQNVTSPTFNIFSIYKGKNTLLHLDAYRLQSEDEVDDLLIEEFLISPYCLVVEWPENIASILPENTWHIYLSILDDKSHLLKLVSD